MRDLKKQPAHRPGENGAGDYAVQNFAVFAHMENLKGKMPLPEYALRLIDTFFTELRRYPDRIGIVRSFRDIEKNMAEGRMSALLTMEEGAHLPGKAGISPDLLRAGRPYVHLHLEFPQRAGVPQPV